MGSPVLIDMHLAEARLLTRDESGLIRWLLAHGDAGATRFLPEVDGLRVVGRCACGCASIDFIKDQVGPMTLVADFGLKGPDGLPGGVFLFTRDDRLAGLEVWSFGTPITTLPEPGSLVE